MDPLILDALATAVACLSLITLGGLALLLLPWTAAELAATEAGARRLLSRNRSIAGVGSGRSPEPVPCPPFPPSMKAQPKSIG